MQRKNICKVSIIIVYYGGFENLMGLLKSIKKNKSKSSYEIILVNNKLDENIWPEVKKEYPKVKFIESSGNIGYGRGNNLGAKHANGKYIFILNPDTELKPYSLDNLVKFLDNHEDAAIVAPNLIYQSGEYLENIGSRALTPIRAIFALSFINKLFPDNQFSRQYYLKDKPKDKLREVDSVPGTAFLIRRNIYEKIGGFDKNFFLFFEETDLCKRVKESGYKIFITPEASAVHDWKPGEGGEALKKIYEKSRFYYFRKNFGLISALFVEGFTRISKYSVSLFFIMVLGTLIRFWGITKYINFGSDVGWYYLQARDFVLSGNIPLLSIPSSVPILKQGPVWTWLLALSMKVGGFNPVSGAVLAALFGLASIVSSYLLVRSWYGRKAAIISSLITGFSYYLLSNDRMPFQTTPIFLTTIIFAFYLKKAIEGKKWPALAVGILMGLLFNLELAGFFVFILVFLLYLKERQFIAVNNLWWTILGLLIGLLPFIASDLKEGVFIQTFGFVAWFLTKVVANFGNLKNGSANIDWGLGFTYIRQFIFPASLTISSVILVSGMFYLLMRFLRGNIKEKSQNEILLVWLLLGLYAFLVRGAFSAAYLPFLFFPVIAMISLFFEFLLTKFRQKMLIFLALMTVVNVLSFYISIARNSVEGVDYQKQTAVSKYIVDYTQGKQYVLTYVGPSSQFETGDSSWKYLLWLYGNEPKASGEMSFSIFVEPYKNTALGQVNVIKDLGNVKIGLEK